MADAYDAFQAAMRPVVQQYGTVAKIVEAFNCETDPKRKQLLEIAGLFGSYLQLKGKSPGAEVLGQQAAMKWTEMNRK